MLDLVERIGNEPTPEEIKRAIVGDVIARDLAALRRESHGRPSLAQLAPKLGEMVFIAPHLVTKY